MRGEKKEPWANDASSKNSLVAAWRSADPEAMAASAFRNASASSRSAAATASSSSASPIAARPLVDRRLRDARRMPSRLRLLVSPRARALVVGSSRSVYGSRRSFALPLPEPEP